MGHPLSKLVKSYRGILSLVAGTKELSFIDVSGKEMIVHETPRTRGLRNFLWEPMTLVGWLHLVDGRPILEVIDFCSEEEPPEVLDLDEPIQERFLSFEGNPIPISPGAA